MSLLPVHAATRRTRYKALGLVLGALAVLGSSPAAKADTITYLGSSGSLAASATFAISGNTLTLTLSNTSSTPVSDPAQVLTALFFTTNGVTLDATSATIASGSLQQVKGSTLYTSTLTNVGAEWAANSAGVGAAGFGVFGSQDQIDPSGTLFSSLSPADKSGTPPDGLAGGIISEFSGSENGGVKDRWLINDSVTFTFSFNGTLMVSDIGNVVFQYGTSLSEPSFPGITVVPPPPPPPSAVPAPPAFLLAGLGMGCFVLTSLRRRLTSGARPAQA